MLDLDGEREREGESGGGVREDGALVREAEEMKEIVRDSDIAVEIPLGESVRRGSGRACGE